MGLTVLLTGARGQLGQALQQRLTDVRLHALGRQQLDLADPDACRAAVLELQPDWVINAGAYTAVDRAEQEPELARAVNAHAPAALAQALERLGRGRLLQISTDFVFDGRQGHPYPPQHLAAADPAGLGVYGASKAAAERAVLERLGPSGRVHVLRTSWVYGAVGHNFCRTMLRLHRERAASGQPLAVVADQVGCPTATSGSQGLAAACLQVLAQVSDGAALPPLLHWCDAGVASWYDFAVAIGEEAVAAGLLPAAAEVQPIRSDQYPTPARRPSYALLEATSSRQALQLQPLHWRSALRQVMAELGADQAR